MQGFLAPKRLLAKVGRHKTAAMAHTHTEQEQGQGQASIRQTAAAANCAPAPCARDFRPYPKLEKYAKRLDASYRFTRFKKYASLIGVGFMFWINDLTDKLVISPIRSMETKLDNWFARMLFGSGSPIKASLYIEWANSFTLVLSLLVYCWLLYWAYMDTYVRRAQGQAVLPFHKKLMLLALINGCTYALLTIISRPWLWHLLLLQLHIWLRQL